MGLDMYLYAEKHVAGFGKSEVEYPPELKELAKIQEKRNFLSVDSTYQIGYWRKDWFVHSLIRRHSSCEGDGSKIELSAEEIKGMVEIIDEVLKDHSKAEELIPNDNYPQEYFMELRYTKKVFGLAIEADANGYGITYYASW